MSTRLPLVQPGASGEVEQNGPGVPDEIDEPCRPVPVSRGVGREPADERMCYVVCGHWPMIW